MPVQFQNSLAFLAAQAQERDLQRQLALADQLEQQNNAAGAQAYQQRTADIQRQNAERRAEATQNAEAQGTLAGYQGQDAPVFDSDLQNSAAGAGQAKGALTFAQLLASRDTQTQQQLRALQNQKDLAGINNDYEMGRIQASKEADATKERSKFDYENPILYGQSMEKQRLENEGKVRSATAGNPALTKTETNKVQEDVRQANQTLVAFKAADEAFKQLTPDDFGLWGAVKDKARQAVESVAPGAMDAKAPGQATRMDAVNDFRLTFTPLANQYIHDMTGAAGSNPEYVRLGRALGMLNINSDVTWNNYRSIARAMQIVQQMTQIRQQMGLIALQTGEMGNYVPEGNVLPPRSGQSASAAVPAETSPRTAEMTQAPPGGVSADGRAIDFNQAPEDPADIPVTRQAAQRTAVASGKSTVSPFYKSVMSDPKRPFEPDYWTDEDKDTFVHTLQQEGATPDQIRQALRHKGIIE